MTPALEARLLRAVLAFACVVFGTGIGWGLPNVETWQSDSLAPYHPLVGLSQLFSFGYFHKYPIVQQVLLAILDLPVVAVAFIASLEPEGFDLYGFIRRVRSPEYATALIVIARVLTAAMAVGTVFFAYRLSRRLFGARAGLLTALCVSLNVAMNQLAPVAKVDVPYVFWAFVSLDLLARALDRGHARDYALSALAGCLAFGTKDQAYAIFVLPWLAYVLLFPLRFGDRGKPAWQRLLGRSQLVFAGAFVIGTLLVENVILGLSGLVKRVDHLTGDAGFRSAAYSPDVSGALALLWDFNLTLVQSMAGAPVYVLVLVGLAAVVLNGSADKRARLVQLMPFLASASYYLFFVQIVRQSHDRFSLFPSVALLCYAGHAIVVLHDRFEGFLRRALHLGLAASFAFALYSTAVLDLDLWLDPRYEAERYLQAHVPEGARIEYYAYPHYLPRFPERARAYRIKQGALEVEARAPELVVLSSLDYARYLGSKQLAIDSGRLSLTARRQRDRTSEYAELYKKLFADELGYQEVARFERRFPSLRRHPSVPATVLVFRRRST